MVKHCLLTARLFSVFSCVIDKRMVANLTEIPTLNKPHVNIRDSSELLKKINKLIEDGKEKLQIVTDFDYTLTRQKMDNGRTVLSSFGLKWLQQQRRIQQRGINNALNALKYFKTKLEIDYRYFHSLQRIKKIYRYNKGMFRSCPSIPQYYKDEDKRLCAYYQPIEADPNISVEEKTNHMVEWYINANKMLRNLKFPRDELVHVAKDMISCFRDGVKELLNWSESHQVPVLVFSAGLGDAVVVALTVANLLKPHVKVVSNFLAVDDNDTITGIQGEIIHTFNKNETAIKNTEYYDLVKDRSNVILMGDSIGDAKMADGMDHCDVTIKIGFLYHNAQENLENYLKQFDIVLIDDQSMDVINSLVSLIN